MVDYNLPRLTYYAEQLASLLSQPDDQAVLRSAVINPEESALLAEIIGMFRQYSCRSTLSKDQVKPLLHAAYAARYIPTVRSQLKRGPLHASKATALWTRICFLGRLRATFFNFLRFTEDSPNIERFYIRCVSLQSSREPSTQRHSMDLNGALALLPDAGSLIITELLKRKRTVDVADSAKKVRRKWTRAGLSARFDALRAEPRYLHTEMQLLLYLAEHSSLERTYAYLGGSKYCCPMCWMFLQCQGKFRTRGCHANMYHKWLVPTTSEYTSGTTQDEMQEVAAKVKNVLIYHLSTGSTTYNNPRAESSLGLTTASLSQMTIKDYDDQDSQQRRSMWDAMDVRSPSPSFDRPLG